MSDAKAKAGILSLAAYIPRAYHSADYIAAHSETPAEVIRTKLGWYQKNVPGPGDGTWPWASRPLVRPFIFPA